MYLSIDCADVKFSNRCDVYLVYLVYYVPLGLTEFSLHLSSDLKCNICFVF